MKRCLLLSPRKTHTTHIDDHPCPCTEHIGPGGGKGCSWCLGWDPPPPLKVLTTSSLVLPICRMILPSAGLRKNCKIEIVRPTLQKGSSLSMPPHLLSLLFYLVPFSPYSHILTSLLLSSQTSPFSLDTWMLYALVVWRLSLKTLAPNPRVWNNPPSSFPYLCTFRSHSLSQVVRKCPKG